MNQIASPTRIDFRTMLHIEDADGNWLPPAVFTDAMIGQANAVLADMERKGLFAPAAPDRIVDWLIRLGVLCSGSMSTDDAKVKISAYAKAYSTDEKPFEAGCFTDASLNRIYPQFTRGFPAAGDVHAALRAEQGRLWKARARLRRMTAPPPKQEDRTPPTPEQQARVAAAIAELQESFKA